MISNSNNDYLQASTALVISGERIYNNNNNNNNNYNQPTFVFETDVQNNNILATGHLIASQSISCNHNFDCNNENVLCLSNGVINFDEIPISALRPKSRELLSKRLNAIKVILSEDGVPRDWRGVLHCVGLSATGILSKNDPMREVLDVWWAERKQTATLGQLQSILGNIDRWDVVDDTSDFFAEDAKIYMKSKARQNEPNTASTIDSNSNIDESNLLTMQDVALARQGMPPQHYDAYVLFAEQDINFASQVIDKMECSGFQICVKERDLIGGTMENDAIMRMISERCERMIVIFSPAFFKSPLNEFFLNFAQLIGIEQRTRKIIPLIYEKCDLPAQLRMYYTLVYKEKASQYYNFWDKLRESLQSVPKNQIPLQTNAIMPRITITEIDSPTQTKRAIEAAPNHSRPTILINDVDSASSDLVAKKRKDKEKDSSKSPKSTPSTPTGAKQFWSVFPKLGSQATISSSMWTLGVTDHYIDKETGRCNSSISLTNSITSPTPTKNKKSRWLNKLLTPNSRTTYKSAESDSSAGGDMERKKKKWYRKRFRSRSKNREAAKDI